MKIKKIAFLFSMIAMFCVLTACSSGKEEVDFSYDAANIIANTIATAETFQNVSPAQRAYWEDSEDEEADIYLTAAQNFDNAKDECGDFVGFKSKIEGEIFKLDYNELSLMSEEEFNEWYTKLINNVDATISEDGANVLVDVVAVYESRDVIYSFVYEKNPEADYAELMQQNVLPYKVKEVVATPDYTFGEKMGKAGANTLMGMGTVFVVLIFISLIIAQFERINKAVIVLAGYLEDVKAKRAAKKAEKMAAKEENVQETVVENKTSSKEKSVVAAPAVSNPMDDSQLVAVITAAIVASSVANGGTDKLVVRSIRKVRR